ncbi:MAG: succinate dehydrogenase [Acidobacteria bacterium]|mgnify:CR=1 FL=1|nr:MAG: succinate dehydrogenase [Acidobacteriota bacterium]
MVSTAQSARNTASKGVAPLRAGTGKSFLLRRLHSLTGIVPVGLFLLEHFISNSEAINGVAAYNSQVKLLTGLPFRLWLEIFGIFLPLAFHGIYGVYIWWRGENNVIDYPWTGNWYYTVQRYTGLIVFAYVTYHIWYMRFAGVHLVDHYDAAFWKVQNELSHPLALGVYVVGVIAASWHFGYGVFLFAAKWGIVTGDKAQKRAQLAGIALSVLLVIIGLISIYSFVAKFPKQQRNPAWDQPAESAAPAEQSRAIPHSIPSSRAR